MSFHSTYSMRNVNIDFGGVIDLSEGKAEDGYLTLSEGSPRASFRKGADGNTSASLASDHSVTVTLSLFPESDTAKLLKAFYYSLKDLERTGEPVLGALPLQISDGSGAVLLVALETVLVNIGDTSLGQDTGTLDFEFYVEDATQNPLVGDLAADLQKALESL